MAGGQGTGPSHSSGGVGGGAGGGDSGEQALTIHNKVVELWWREVVVVHLVDLDHKVVLEL